MAKQTECNNDLEKLERKLGQLAFQIGKKQEEMRKLNVELQDLQKQANEVATEIEKFGK